MDISQLKEILRDQPAFRHKQAQNLIYKNLISDWNEASNFPLALREKLAEACPLEIVAEILSAKDKTDKALLTLADGVKIETVLMRHADGRRTACVSSQAGCVLGCAFCATGQSGFRRNLTADEIVEQGLYFARRLKKFGESVTNVVFMGMGEPFLNYDNVMAAVKIFNDGAGLNIGARHISISTAGIPEGIRELAKEGIQVNLAVSLHAGDDALRSELMPLNRKHNLKKVLAAVEFYQARTNRKVMFEYLLIDGVNDSAEQAEQTAALLDRFDRSLFIVNLITYNQTGIYQPSRPERREAFHRVLASRRINATQRFRFGHDIAAACGQLAKK